MPQCRDPVVHKYALKTGWIFVYFEQYYKREVEFGKKVCLVLLEE